MSDITTPTPQEIPQGYEPFIGPDGKTYLLPQYLRDTPTMRAAAASNNVNKPTDPTNSPKPFITIAGGQPIAEHEARDLHEEITALQKAQGITYKDAAHRLYLAELATIQANFDAMNAFSSVNIQLRNTTSVWHFHASNSVNSQN
ncbi:hypothetical protein BDN70DRAFT_939891 [Pholiota conissans]|uniref:Uncharacterized protein n=1 Tax=Pholiota conissans TaxID=109636 RepID=A0A9P5YMD8_9AGAR|nr:hypothetical protein BDN70DRAFT_939891 [Pholiota conissans]